MRRARIFAKGAAALLAFLLVGVHVYARVFRFRAERLLTKLKSFQVEETPAAALLRLREDYHSNVTDEGKCSGERCAFSIELIEWESLLRLPSNHAWTERLTYYLVRGLRFFGLRLNYFMASAVVERGKLRSLSVALRPMSYIEYGRPNELGSLSNIAIGAGTVGNFRRWIGWPRVYEHPNSLVSKPSARTGCSGAINAEFT
jgi:hypothetical protein